MANLQIYSMINQMLKILPLIIISSLFFLIFINVKNLTPENQIKDNNSTNIKPNSDEEIIDIDDPTKANLDLDIENEIIENKENIMQTRSFKKIKEPSDKSFSKKEEQLIKKSSKLENKAKESKVNNQEESLNSDSNEPLIKKNDQKKELVSQNKKINENKSIKEKPKLENRMTKIQFGAFSKINNAEKQKVLISKELSVKFPNFEEKFNISNENNLYKLIYISRTLQTAKSICEFSRSKKISCLILNK